ncbi:MAG: carboxymuconolactone decarboxylase family protein [Ignavibacteriae bacterium]|nr:carboxymuconolactone decarboxylase family protein [Ignavibacteriota bacterium]
MIFGKELSANSVLLCYAAASGCTNRMKELENSIKVGLEQKIVTEKEFYEALLQIYLFAGFPAAIESLSILDVFVDSKAGYENYDVEKFRKRGEALCKKIYTSVYAKMRSRIGRVSPELDEWMIIEGYGKTLSREGLTPKTRELITASSLIALGWENQLFSHIRGAIAVGATPGECFELLDIVSTFCSEEQIERYKIVIERVLNKTT